MARPRKPDFSNHAGRITAALKKHDVEPLERLLYLASEKIEVPADFVPKIPKKMFERWELLPKEDGGATLVRVGDFQARIYLGILPFIYPALKSSESREQVDHQITVTIRKFEEIAHETVKKHQTITLGSGGVDKAPSGDDHRGAADSCGPVLLSDASGLPGGQED